MASISAVGHFSNHFPAKPAAVSPPRPPLPTLRIACRSSTDSSSSREGSGSLEHRPMIDRRKTLISSIGFLAVTIFDSQWSEASVASEYADMPALRGKDYGKTKMRYPDYIETNSGLQYKDLRVGSGPTPKIGETVVVDWDGYTIGYYGRIFEARNKTKGGSFEGDDKDFYKFRLGSQQVIPALEEAVSGMALGGVRRIIVPPELGYPDNDFNKKGPRPTTFSGQRALDFVLRNQGLIDKTLLFDIELLKIVSNGSG
ncbi:FKBP-type peptidyl-prolyl cis-trans isomerase [Handroanthus impetiginosus]|uniref:peptidylprolyl isomerase n=1 Tax=Handroanthus impetiginosus TaxID=429701 RepID=A0A2G9FYB5_9LAMI|nr:FKBP-type peptidyl-prolyl cis-trans isomerase [Handroanthus impetiginosus]